MAIAAVVTPAHVREINSNPLSDDQLNGLISAAMTFVSSRLGSCSIEPDVQAEIIRWTAAHFVAVRGSQAASTVVEEKVGDASVKYESSSITSPAGSMLNLRSTFFGQTAIAFDPTGTLGSLGGKPPLMVSL